MAKELTALVDTQISVITNDGRNIIGILRGFDQTTNLILEDCFERVYSANSGVEQAVLGLYIIRGDNIAVIELGQELDASLDLSTIHAARSEGHIPLSRRRSSVGVAWTSVPPPRRPRRSRHIDNALVDRHG